MIPERLPTFIGILLVILCVPGPDFAVIVRHALASAPSGLRAAAGNILGLAVHTGLAALGVAAVMAANPAALDAVRLAGAGYLTWMGATALHGWLVRRRRPHGEPAVRTNDGFSNAHPFRDGFATNLLNPKALFFFVGVIPQFVSSGSHVTAQTLILAGTTMLLASLWWLVVVQATDRVARLLSNPGVKSALDGVSGVTFLTLAMIIVVPMMTT